MKKMIIILVLLRIYYKWYNLNTINIGLYLRYAIKSATYSNNNNAWSTELVTGNLKSFNISNKSDKNFDKVYKNCIFNGIKANNTIYI